MTSMARRTAGTDKPDDAQTVFRGYRLNEKLVTAFEKDCDETLRSPRMVVETLLRYWLAADLKSKAHIAAFRTQGRGRAKKSA